MVSEVIAKAVPILTGTTASGKSEFALSFCRKHPTIEIVNADSIQVYRGMDLGSAKPTPQEQSEVRHHLLDVRSPDEPYSAGDFYQDVLKVLDEVHSRGNRALIVGGTGFYLKALRYGLWDVAKPDPEKRKQLELQSNEALYQQLQAGDPEYAGKVEKNDRYRLIRSCEILLFHGKKPSQLESERPTSPRIEFPTLILDRDANELNQRISLRTKKMLDSGFLEEVQNLHKTYPDARSLQAVGYRQCLDYLAGKKPEGRKVAEGLLGLESEIALATRQLVKRQRTWFRGEKDALHFVLDRDRSLVSQSLESVYLN